MEISRRDTLDENLDVGIVGVCHGTLLVVLVECPAPQVMDSEHVAQFSN
jgi:hypothetical protein